MPDQRKSVVIGMFDRIAGIYDLGNHVLSLGLDFAWRKRLARELAAYHPAAALDLACGTGDLAFAIKKEIPSVNILGVDLAMAMLEIFERKIKRRGMSDSISVLPGDVEALPMSDGRFDAAAMAFGIRNLENRPQGLAEIFRVLKPGGVLALLEFSLPEPSWFATLYRLYLGTMLPLIGRVLGGDRAYFYLRDTIREFPAPPEFCRELEAAGFVIKASIALSRGAVQLYLAEKPKNPG